MYTNTVDAGGATTATVSGMAGGLTYFVVTAYDASGLESLPSNEVSYNVPVPNQPPTLNPLANMVLTENAPQQTVALSGITCGPPYENQPMTVTATSSNPGLIANPTVNYSSPNTTGSLTFTPAAYGSGTATISVVVDDGQTNNNTITRSFVVTVNAVNQQPTLNPIGNVAIYEDAGMQTINLAGITSGAPNENQTLSVTATSANPSLIPNPTVNYTSPNTTGTLAFIPVPDAFGSTVVTLTVNDGGSSNNVVTRTFTVTVNGINDPPTLDPISDVAVNENAGVQVINLSGITSGSAAENQTLTVTAASSNPGLVPDPAVAYSSPDTFARLTFTPVANAAGTANVTVTVNDGGASNNIVSRTFAVTVNAAPFIGGIASQTINTNSVAGPIAFVIGDAETPADNLVLSATSSRASLVPASNIVFGGSGSNRTVTVTPLADQSGTADITITASDGSATASTTFQLTVQIPSAPPGTLIVITNGNGTISPNPATLNLTVGKTYTLTAIPGNGGVFTSWTGTYNSTNAKLTFLMASNVLLQANFASNATPPIAGTYNGLFYESDQVRLQRSGSFSIAVTTRGTYSGKLQVAGNRYSFTGSLDARHHATNAIMRALATSLLLDLQFGGSAGPNQISGQVRCSSWLAQLWGTRAVFNSKTNPAPYAGNYTLLIPGQNSNPSVPMGNGFASVRIDASGNVKLAGSLSDGSKLTMAVPISANGYWPLYAPLYLGNGEVLSWLSVTNSPDQDLAGALAWIKWPNPVSRFYVHGFTNQCEVIGSSYSAPVNANILDLTQGRLEFYGGNLPKAFTNLISLGLNSKVINASSNPLFMTFSLSTGTFSGKTTDPVSGKIFSFGGAVLQKRNAGYGYLLGTNECSQVLFTP